MLAQAARGGKDNNLELLVLLRPSSAVLPAEPRVQFVQFCNPAQSVPYAMCALGLLSYIPTLLEGSLKGPEPKASSLF